MKMIGFRVDRRLWPQLLARRAVLSAAALVHAAPRFCTDSDEVSLSDLQFLFCFGLCRFPFWGFRVSVNRVSRCGVRMCRVFSVGFSVRACNYKGAGSAIPYLGCLSLCGLLGSHDVSGR